MRGEGRGGEGTLWVVDCGHAGIAAPGVEGAAVVGDVPVTHVFV